MLPASKNSSLLEAPVVLSINSHWTTFATSPAAPFKWPTNIIGTQSKRRLLSYVTLTNYAIEALAGLNLDYLLLSS